MLKKILEEYLGMPDMIDGMVKDDYCILCGHPISKKIAKEKIKYLHTAIGEEIRKCLPKKKKAIIGQPESYGFNEAISEMERNLEGILRGDL